MNFFREWCAFFKFQIFYFIIIIVYIAYPECSATRFLRNWDNIFEKNRPFLRSISEARSLASLTPF